MNTSKFHRGYPATYLKRLRAFFPDAVASKTLHLFAGMIDRELFPGATVDINPDLHPDFIDDAQTLKRTPIETFDLVLASMPPGEVYLRYRADGKEAWDGTQEFCWLMFSRGYMGLADIAWLHRGKKRKVSEF